MRRIFSLAVMISSIATAQGGEKDKRFSPPPASSFASKQTQAGVTVAAAPYISEDDIKAAFGKANPPRYGILPVLVIIQNDSGKALRLSLEAEYIDPDGKHIEAVPPADVMYAGKSPKRPTINPTPLPLPRSPGKSPLATWEIEGRAFSARMVPPGESVSGFFYFQTKFQPGSKLYLTGLSEAQTGKELFYFEIPLESKADQR
ncbi:MAG TPA: hypothetical protein VFA28_19115 [Bryobacteraceae bacterium]|nr:hypothetical protein [Bryobacteraceae bacterium]